METSIFYPLHCGDIVWELLDYEQTYKTPRACFQTISDNSKKFPQIVVKLISSEGKLSLQGNL